MQNKLTGYERAGTMSECRKEREDAAGALRQGRCGWQVKSWDGCAEQREKEKGDERKKGKKKRRSTRPTPGLAGGRMWTRGGATRADGSNACA